MNNFLRKWIVFGDEEFNLARREIAPGELLNDQPGSPVMVDEILQDLLAIPTNREDLKELFAKKFGKAYGYHGEHHQQASQLIFLSRNHLRLDAFRCLGKGTFKLFARFEFCSMTGRTDTHCL